MEEIKIYTNETCNYCKELKKSLDEEKVEYTNINTHKHEQEWQKVVDITFIPTVPTIEYKDTYFVAGRDFHNGKQLMEMLKSFKGFDVDDPRLVLERIRTLTYSMTMAFGRMDNLLRSIEGKLKTEKDEH
jgi:glutaredoxin